MKIKPSEEEREKKKKLVKTEPSEEERKKKKKPMKTEPMKEEEEKKKSVGQKVRLSGSLMCV